MISLALMIFATVAWVWKGYIELSLILCAWGIWMECVSGTATIMYKLTPPSEVVKRMRDLTEKFKSR